MQNTAGNVIDSYFGNNSVTTNGGAIFRGTSTGNVTDNVFYGNSASSDGGAIYDSHVSVPLPFLVRARDLDISQTVADPKTYLSQK
jgi:predicted outer membrane repeat protein